jgi:hypothetical protein
MSKELKLDMLFAKDWLSIVVSKTGLFSVTVLKPTVLWKAEGLFLLFPKSLLLL